MVLTPPHNVQHGDTQNLAFYSYTIQAALCQLATWFSLTGSRSKCVLLCTGWAAQRDVKYVRGWLENENGENNVLGREFWK